MLVKRSGLQQPTTWTRPSVLFALRHSPSECTPGSRILSFKERSRNSEVRWVFEANAFPRAIIPTVVINVLLSSRDNDSSVVFRANAVARRAKV